MDFARIYLNVLQRLVDVAFAPKNYRYVSGKNHRMLFSGSAIVPGEELQLDLA